MAIRVIFLSRSNAARSQIAEYLLNKMGHGRFDAVSAGSMPAPVNPLAIRVLEELKIDAQDAVSKPIECFEDDDFDFIICICDDSSASCESIKPDCPTLPGRKSQGCWGFGRMPDGDADEAEVQQYLRGVRDQIANRLRIWMAAVDKSGRDTSHGMEVHRPEATGSGAQPATGQG